MTRTKILLVALIGIALGNSCASESSAPGGPGSPGSPGSAGSPGAPGMPGDPTPASSVVAPVGAPTGAVDVPAINKQFSEMKEVASFVAKFERESREIFAQRVAIADTVRLRPCDRVADIGCGTGLFEPYFALAVGPAGKVIAVDIAPLFLEHVRQRALLESLPNVTTLLCDQTSTHLPPASIDVVFACDTYHHFENPAATLASIHAALVPGGRFVIVDFHKIAGKSSDFVMGHVRAGEETVRAEIEAAGFEQVRRETFLQENYVLEFRRK